MQKDRYTPITNGMINAKENAINVGSTKMGKYRFNVFCISLSPFLQTQGPWYRHRPVCLKLYKMDNDLE